MATMGLSRTVSDINGDFSRKSHIFPNPVYLTPPIKGFPWNMVSALGFKKTRMMGLPGRERSLMISSAAWLDTRHEHDGQKDGRSDSGRQQRPR